MEGKGESEQSPLLWTPEELEPKSNISKSLREGAKVLLGRMFYEIFLNINHSRGEKRVEIQHCLSSQSCDSKERVQQTNAGCVLFPEQPKCSSQRLCCNLDIQNKHTGHQGHKSSCTPQVTPPSLQEILPFRSSPGPELQQQLLTPLHPGLPMALSSSNLPCQGRDSIWSWKTTGSKIPSTIKQAEGHLSWLLTLNMQK